MKNDREMESHWAGISDTIDRLVDRMAGIKPEDKPIEESTKGPVYIEDALDKVLDPDKEERETLDSIPDLFQESSDSLNKAMEVLKQQTERVVEISKPTVHEEIKPSVIQKYAKHRAAVSEMYVPTEVVSESVGETSKYNEQPKAKAVYYSKSDIEINNLVDGMDVVKERQYQNIQHIFENLKRNKEQVDPYPTALSLMEEEEDTTDYFTPDLSEPEPGPSYTEGYMVGE